MSRQLAMLAMTLTLFSFVHSLLATRRAQQIGMRWGLGPRAARLLYNVISIVLMIPAWALLSGAFPIIWHAEGTVRVVLLAVQWVAVFGFVITFRGFDVREFIGLRAPSDSGSESGTPGAQSHTAPVLQAGGTYALCRHPLYFFTGLFFSAWPLMDAGRLVFAIWVWLYAWVGSIFEERRLVITFGPAYRTYQRTHRRLLPFGPRSRSQMG